MISKNIIRSIIGVVFLSLISAKADVSYNLGFDERWDNNVS